MGSILRSPPTTISMRSATLHVVGFAGGFDARRFYGIGGLLVLFGALIVYDLIVRRDPHPGVPRISWTVVNQCWTSLGLETTPSLIVRRSRTPRD